MPLGFIPTPDVVVVCDEPEFEDSQADTLLDPTIMIEVLSKSTESCDRGKKSGHYRRIPSLKAYLLISQGEPHIEHYARQADGHWVLTESTGLETTIAVPALETELALSEVYARVVFGE